MKWKSEELLEKYWQRERDYEIKNVICIIVLISILVRPIIKFIRLSPSTQSRLEATKKR